MNIQKHTPLVSVMQTELLWSRALLTNDMKIDNKQENPECMNVEVHLLCINHSCLGLIVIHPCRRVLLGFYLVHFFSCADEALQKQEKIWQQEVEESLSFCSSLSHPSRPKHIDFLRITAPEDDLIDTPASSPLPSVAQVSSYLFDCVR